MEQHEGHNTRGIRTYRAPFTFSSCTKKFLNYESNRKQNLKIVHLYPVIETAHYVRTVWRLACNSGFWKSTNFNLGIA